MVRVEYVFEKAPLRERIIEALNILRYGVPRFPDQVGWTTSIATTIEPEALESINRGLNQSAAIDRGSFAKYVNEQDLKS